jgi:hypothetical protein
MVLEKSEGLNCGTSKVASSLVLVAEELFVDFWRPVIYWERAEAAAPPTCLADFLSVQPSIVWVCSAARPGRNKHVISGLCRFSRATASTSPEQKSIATVSNISSVAGGRNSGRGWGVNDAVIYTPREL